MEADQDTMGELLVSFRYSYSLCQTLVKLLTPQKAQKTAGFFTVCGEEVY